MAFDPADRRELLRRLGAGECLSATEAPATFASLLMDEWREAEVAALLTALRLRGETVDELVGAASALRSRLTPLAPPISGLLDTCGTGGDRSGTFNISTAVAIVASACGVPVAKHGNRSVSSRSGSADVLGELGFDVAADNQQVVECLRQRGLAFFFAPQWHAAMKAVAPVRAALGFRTIFNLVGPLSNPVGAEHQLIGVGRFGPAEETAIDLQRTVAEALLRLGTRSSIVVSGRDGLDEVSLAAPTRVLRISNQTITEEQWAADDFGLKPIPLAAVRVDSPQASAAVIRAVLAGERCPHRDYVLANAAGALLAAGKVDELRAGVAAAGEAIDSGAARQRLKDLIEFRK